jgi:hypothetical protein
VIRPLVTIVTPSYNQGHFIRQTIESVLAQDYPRIEYIVMDGGSTDETAAVVAEYASRVKFVSERDRGQSHAINKGFAMAAGEVVSWINSDDVILPGAVRHAVQRFEANPQIGAVYGEGYLIDRDGAVKCRFPATEKFNLWKLIYASDYVLQQTVYFRRSVFEEIGFIDESLNWGMDWDVLIRIAKRYGLEYIPEYMGCLREYGEAKTFSGGVRRFRELAQIMRRHGAMRYPPGYITYGLDTYQNVVANAIERMTPAVAERPSSFIRKAVAYGAHRVIAKVLRDCQGLYPDGWAGPALRYMLPAASGRVEINGMLPGFSQAFDGQRLTVRCDGRLAAEVDIAVGEFSVHFDRPRDADPLEAAEIEISASKWIVPAKSGMGPDPRKLSYMLRSLNWAGAEKAVAASVGAQ